MFLVVVLVHVVKGDNKIKKRGQHRIPKQAARAHTAGGNHMWCWCLIHPRNHLYNVRDSFLCTCSKI